MAVRLVDHFQTVGWVCANPLKPPCLRDQDTSKVFSASIVFDHTVDTTYLIVSLTYLAPTSYATFYVTKNGYLII